MADATIANLTNGATADATDRIPVERSPFGAGTNRYITPGYLQALIGTFPRTVSGATSGGIPYFSSTTAEASSGLLASGGVVLGGGAGAAPATNAGLTFNTTTLRATIGSTSSGVTQGWIIGGDGSASQSKMWSSVVTPSSTNYCFATDNNYTWLNASSGAEVQFRINNSEIGRISGTGFAISNVTHTGYAHFTEMTAPAGAANSARLFTQDNGGGKTQLMVIFGSGAAIQLAIEV